MTKSRIYLYFVWLLLPVVTGIRTWELANAIDPNNGFYFVSHLDLCNSIEYGTLAILFLAFVLGRFWLPSNKEMPKQSFLIGGAGLALAVTTVLQASIDFVAGSPIYLLCSGLTALGFTVMAAGYLNGKNPIFLASALPVIGELIRLIVAYSHFNGIADISENIIHVLFMCSFLSFCLFHSRIYTNIGAAKGIGWLYGTATATGVFGLCSSVPHWIMGQNQSTLSVMSFGAALYAIVFLSVVVFTETNNTVEEQPTEDTDDTPEQPLQAEE